MYAQTAYPMYTQQRLSPMVLLGFFVMLVITFFIYRNLKSNENLVVLFKPKSKVQVTHHINISRLVLYDEDDKEIPLTFKDTTSYQKDDQHPKKMLDGDNSTFYHTASDKDGKWKHNRNVDDQYNTEKNNSRWVSFTIPSDKKIKKFYVRPRTNYQSRMKDMKLKIFSDVEADPEKEGDIYNYTFNDIKKDYTINIEEEKKKEEENKETFISLNKIVPWNTY